MKRLEKLWRAQIKHTRDLLIETCSFEFKYCGDDCMDEIKAACNLAARLTELRLDDDKKGLKHLLNEEIDSYACGGIASEIVDLCLKETHHE